MDKFIVRGKRLLVSSTDSTPVTPIDSPPVTLSDSIPVIANEFESVGQDAGSSRGKRIRTENAFERNFDIVSDPALRKPIIEYDNSVRDDVKREYIVQGPCLPNAHDFPKSLFGSTLRCFQVEWFDEWKWLEYSVSTNGVYCFYCYLFKADIKKRSRDDVFVKKGFQNWKKATEKFRQHVGARLSTHNEAMGLYFTFKDQSQSLPRKLFSGNETLSAAYRTRLTASLDVSRLLLLQGLAFRGHREMIDSLNKGNFLEFLNWYGSRNVDVGKVVNDNAPGNNKLTSHQIQKDIISACASETIKAIISDIGDKWYSLLVDEARDCSVKEQMAIVLRYVNNQGLVMERFVGVVHVLNTTLSTLKSGIDEFFAKYGLSLSKLRGQGYDGASNMRGELNGLKAIILNENPSARYIHCFAHQLQLVIVAVAEMSSHMSDFFEYLSMVTNMVGVSCKRRDEFRQSQHECMVEKIANGDVPTGRGLNQECSLARPGATRWGSHYTTIVRLLSLWPSTIQVLENVFEDGTDYKARGTANSLGRKIRSYQFVFIAHLMKEVLALTNTLSQLLQQKDQNILEAVFFIRSTKKRLQVLRESGWDKLVEKVNNFCDSNDIVTLKMEDNYDNGWRSQSDITNDHHFRIDIFYEVIGKLCEEMDSRFSEANTELLTCIGCLDPKNSFANFDDLKILRLAEMYPADFSTSEMMVLEGQLDTWIHVMRENEKFSVLQGIGDVARKMVEFGYSTALHLVYRVIELVLVLPVATASVERAFSALKIVKADLRNRMGDDFLTDSLVCYIEREIFKSIDSEAIMQHFQSMKTRKHGLSALPSNKME